MSENNVLGNALNECTDETLADTIPSDNSKVIIPIKYNKEIINLNLEKAQELAQKGMKFDMISADYEALKELAAKDNKNVGEYIHNLKKDILKKRLNEVTEKCGGDNEFAKHILKLENGNNTEIRGFDELKECFPKITTIEDLPESVVEAAKLKGTLLLDEYLRFLHKENLVMNESIKKQNLANQSAMGPFVNKKGGENPETAEFLRGLWRKE
ncbi:MAG: hypothetical protein IJD45_03500 [Clostridia bacterium]|nr:hypothetical protein [Clostridia bacterium]